jgi:hypothetical protein
VGRWFWKPHRLAYYEISFHWALPSQHCPLHEHMLARLLAVVDACWAADGACLLTVGEDQTARITTRLQGGHWCEIARPQVRLLAARACPPSCPLVCVSAASLFPAAASWATTVQYADQKGWLTPRSSCLAIHCLPAGARS